MLISNIKQKEHPLLSIFVQKIQKTGNKFKANKLIYKTLYLIEKHTEELGIKLIENAVKNVTLPIILKAHKLGGSVYQIPIPIPYFKAVPLAVKSLINAAQNKKGISLEQALYTELLDANKKKGIVWNKKQQIIKQALHNRNFSYWINLKQKTILNTLSIKNLLVANQKELIEQKILFTNFKKNKINY